MFDFLKMQYLKVAELTEINKKLRAGFNLLDVFFCDEIQFFSKKFDISKDFLDQLHEINASVCTPGSKIFTAYQDNDVRNVIHWLKIYRKNAKSSEMAYKIINALRLFGDHSLKEMTAEEVKLELHYFFPKFFELNNLFNKAKEEGQAIENEIENKLNPLKLELKEANEIQSKRREALELIKNTLSNPETNSKQVSRLFDRLNNEIFRAKRRINLAQRKIDNAIDSSSGRKHVKNKDSNVEIPEKTKTKLEGQLQMLESLRRKHEIKKSESLETAAHNLEQKISATDKDIEKIKNKMLPLEDLIVENRNKTKKMITSLKEQHVSMNSDNLKQMEKEASYFIEELSQSNLPAKK